MLKNISKCLFVLSLVVLSQGADDSKCEPLDISMSQEYAGVSADGYASYLVILKNNCGCYLKTILLTCGGNVHVHAVTPAGVLQPIVVPGGAATCKFADEIQPGAVDAFRYEADRKWDDLGVVAVRCGDGVHA